MSEVVSSMAPLGRTCNRLASLKGNNTSTVWCREQEYEYGFGNRGRSSRRTPSLSQVALVCREGERGVMSGRGVLAGLRPCKYAVLNSQHACCNNIIAACTHGEHQNVLQMAPENRTQCLYSRQHINCLVDVAVMSVINGVIRWGFHSWHNTCVHVCRCTITGRPFQRDAT